MPRTLMKKPSRKFRKFLALRRKAGCVVGASLLAAGVQSRAADAVTPEQLYEGGTNTYNNWIELGGGDLIRSGNKAQAEQGAGLPGGAFGGIEDLHYQTEVAKKTTLAVDGHYLPAEHDYKLGLDLEKEDFGFIKFSYENFRTYDAANGGYSPVDAQAFPNPGDAPALDRGKISFEAGYNKEGKPKVTFKYTHTDRDGEEGSTLWGPPPAPSASNLRPVSGIEAIHDQSDSVQVDVSQKIKSTQVGLGVRYETGRMDNAGLLTSFGNQVITDQEGTSYNTESVHASTETWLKPNLFLSTGFMFDNLDETFSGSRVYGDDFDVVYSPAYPANYYGYYHLNGNANQKEYVLNVNLLSLPTKNNNFTLSPSLRVEKEDWEANSSEQPTFAPATLDTLNNSSGYDTIDVREQLAARYTGITNWVYSATGQWTEGQGSLNENGGFYNPLAGPDGPAPTQFSTDDKRFFQKYAVSARWYPTRLVSVDFGGYYKDNRYNYDTTGDSTNNLSAGLLYPGFLAYQGFQTWDGSTRLTLHPFSRLMLVSRYEYQLSTIETTPEASSGLAGAESSRMFSHILGQNASWTPLNWLSLQAGANYVISETKTPASDGTQSLVTQSILNSQNNYWTVNFNAGFVLDEKTDLNLGYYFYRAADGQNTLVNGLPLGTDALEHSVMATLTRRITPHLRWNLKYGFTHYDDFASAGAYNFKAQVVYTSLQYRF
jgi:hypothetical protein